MRRSYVVAALATVLALGAVPSGSALAEGAGSELAEQKRQIDQQDAERRRIQQQSRPNLGRDYRPPETRQPRGGYVQQPYPAPRGGPPPYERQYDRRGYPGPRAYAPPPERRGPSGRDVGIAIGAGVVGGIILNETLRARGRGYGGEPPRYTCSALVRICDDGEGWACAQFDNQCRDDLDE
jgi:hypothetical protein